LTEERRHALYSEVLTVVEGALESSPQFALQLYTYLRNEKKNSTRPVLGLVPYRAFFFLSSAFSVLGILKAAFNFWWDREEMKKILRPPAAPVNWYPSGIPK